MALTIFVEVSDGGMSDDDFAPLTSYADTGATVNYDHAPVTPGLLYIYRARRFDSVTGLYSTWAYAIARASHQQRTAMSGFERVNDVATDSQMAAYWAPEIVDGLVSKALYRFNLVAYTPPDNITTRKYSRQKANTTTRRRNAMKGKMNYSHSMTVEVTPEGAFPVALGSALYIESTTSLTTPTRYRTRYSNKSLRSCPSGTLYIVIDNLIHVYPGTRLTTLGFSPDFDGSDVAIATMGIGSAGYIGFDTNVTAGILSSLGISTASADTIGAYNPMNGVVTLNGIAGAGTGDFSVNWAFTLEEVKKRDGTFGPKAFVPIFADPTLSANAIWDPDAALMYYASLGYSSAPAAPFGPRQTMVTSAFSLTFTPPNNQAGYSNIFGWYYTDSDFNVQIQTPDNALVKVAINAMPLDRPGNAAGTDGYIEITNSYSGPTLATYGVPVDPSLFGLFDDREYNYGKATGVPTTTSISIGGANLHLSTVDGAYVGHRLMVLSGAKAGEIQQITAYTGATQTFTTAAFSGAIATNDYVGVL